jgi:DNA-binding NtrC family response regulator
MNPATAETTGDKYHQLKLEPQTHSLLIIEDDLSVVEFFEVVLDHLKPGLSWDYATSAEQAMELIQERGRVNGAPPYSLVIADIFLDGDMTGFDSWLDCAQEYPDMPFVITSSLSLDRYLAILSGFENTPAFLPKPLTMGRCKSVIEEYF